MIINKYKSYSQKVNKHVSFYRNTRAHYDLKRQTANPSFSKKKKESRRLDRNRLVVGFLFSSSTFFRVI